jgi:hypothetical protein
MLWPPLLPGEMPSKSIKLANLKFLASVYIFLLLIFSTASVVKWSEFLATDPEVPVSIPGAATFSEK